MTLTRDTYGDAGHAVDLALFGALGDLARGKLWPALFQLDRQGLLDPATRILALSHHDGDTAALRQKVAGFLEAGLKEDERDADSCNRFLGRLAYRVIDFTRSADYTAVAEWRRAGQGQRPLVVYPAVGARLYGAICAGLAQSESLGQHDRIVVEKPVGHDLASSRAVNDAVGAVFPESRIYRIDHYLGKETVQNLMALRFANPLFGNQWNQSHISHVEITVAEEVGIAGRWSYFDRAGQLRDMVQNHLLQLLCLVAMDPPSSLDADAIRDEKVKVLKTLGPLTPEALARNVVRGQYRAGTCNGRPVPGYREEAGADSDSHTETFVALKTEVANWRWAGVPFYLRTGKRLPQKLSRIVIHFRRQPHYIFDPDQRRLASNKLIIRLQPDEGIALQVLTKDSGLEKGMRLRTGPLHLDFNSAFPEARIPDAYERLLLEVMKGRQSLFVRRDEVEHAWRWCEQLLDHWQNLDTPPGRYPASSWGPVASAALMTRDGRSWYEESGDE